MLFRERRKSVTVTRRVPDSVPPARPLSLGEYVADAHARCLGVHIGDGGGPMGPAHVGSATTTPFPFSVQFKAMPRKQHEAP